MGGPLIKPLRALLLALAFCSVLSIDPADAKRVALVIGIDDYQSLPKLQKAVNDARAVAGALRDLGFDTIVGENLTRRDMNRRLADLEGTIGPGDTVFFFFAGHGIAIGADNILLPVDMPRPRNGEEGLVRDEGYSVDGIIRRVQGRGALLSLFVLDACRENPFEAAGTRNIGGTRGLARPDAPKGVFVLFSAGLGQTALDVLRPDDPNPNSVFTRRLVPLLRTPGLSHVLLAKRVQQEVDELAATVRHPQQPAYYDQIVGEIVLRPALPGGAAPAAPLADSADAERQRLEMEARIADETRRRERAEAEANAARLALRKIEDPRQPAQPSGANCPATFGNYRGSSTELSCYCSPGAIGGTVWGSNPYTDDSSICGAARHAGVIAESGGTVRLRAAPGRRSYPASRRNGIATSSYDRWDGSFVFTSTVVAAAASEPDPTCPADVRSYRGSSQRLSCLCQPQNMSGTVWGSDTYTDDSSVCLAAVHAGVISRSGGQVTLVTQAGRGSYAGSSKNGVQSDNYGRWGGSFRFVQ